MRGEHQYRIGGKRDTVNGKTKPIFWDEESALARRWSDLKLHPNLERNLVACNYPHPINAQEYALKPLMAHLNGFEGVRQDARIKSLTGTGKTLTFLVPIINSLMNKISPDADIEKATAMLAEATIGKREMGFKKITKSESTIQFRQKNKSTKLMKVIAQMLNDGYRRKPNALILVPTRELAIQIKDDAAKLLKGTEIRTVALYSNPEHLVTQRGKRQVLTKYADSFTDAEQASALRDGANIVVATLGQLTMFIEHRVLDLRHLDHFVIDEADQLLLPRSDERPRAMQPGAAFKKLKYFGGLKDLTSAEQQSLEAFKEKFHFEDELAAILYDCNLMHFNDGQLQFRNKTKTQVILTSAHIEPDDLRDGFNKIAIKKITASKPDRVTIFANRFMREHNIQVIGMQTMRMHPQVVHSFKKAAPYDERAPGGKTNYTRQPRKHIVEDKAKNDYLVKELAEAVKQHLSVMVFIERTLDVENLYEQLCLLEPKFNADEKSVVGRISSLQTQEDREDELEKFHEGETLVLVTTNVCSRGLDLCKTRVDWVVNYTLPEWTDSKSFMGYGRQMNDYIYRVGRMARAGDVIDSGRKLRCISFYSEPKNRTRTPVSSSEMMAKFIRMEILQYRNPDNTPDAADDDAYPQIMSDAEKY